jgi:hypothetical protein
MVLELKIVVELKLKLILVLVGNVWGVDKCFLGSVKVLFDMLVLLPLSFGS